MWSRVWNDEEIHRPLEYPELDSSMAKFHAPEAFDFTAPIEWPDWFQRFSRYRLATKLNKEEDIVQISALIYAMGRQGEHIFKSLVFETAGDEDKYEKVVEKLNGYFIPKRNVIHERAKFHLRSEGPTESIEAFVRSLYEIAEYCDFGLAKDEQIRDRLVIGITDKSISEKLQLKGDLTLDTALQMARQAEQVKSHIKDQATKAVDAVNKTTKKWPRRPSRPPQQQNPVKSRQGQTHGGYGSSKQTYQNSGGSRCSSCNRTHSRGSCPAYGKSCHKCKGMNHFSVCCKSKQVHEVVHEAGSEEFFLGAITTGSSEAWKVILPVCGSSVTLKIDTGADISVISEGTFNRFKNRPTLKKVSPSMVLQSPGGTLGCLGQFTRDVKYKGQDYSLEFYVVGGQHASNLLSRDAALKLGLVIRIEETVKINQSVFGSSGLVNCEPATIQLRDDVRPYCVTTARRVPFPLLDKVSKELERMETEGIIEKVTEATDWCAPMVPVVKKNGNVRICVDLKKLNEGVKREIFMLPTLDDISPKLVGAKVFSKLDASSGFYQIPLHLDSSKLTTFITPLGRFCFRRVPFGITSAPEIFQRKMLELLAGLEGVEAIIDDTLIYGRTVEEHDERLQKVMDRIEASGLKLNPEKCEFGKSRIEYLGHVISSDGISPNPKRVEAIRNLEAPKDVSELRRVIGMINYLGRFLPELSSTMKPMTDLLKSDQVWAWTPMQEHAFNNVKQKLTETPILNFYDAKRPTVVSADASSFGLGAALFQRDDNDELRPITFCSRTLTTAEVKYAQIEKECLASVWACEKFARYLVGLENFRLLTDHKPLVPLINTQDLDRTPLRCQRLLMRLRRFNPVAEHVPGKLLVVPDTLSRSPMKLQQDSSDNDVEVFVNSVESLRPISDVRLEHIRQAQFRDASLQKALVYTKHGWPDRESCIDEAAREYFASRNELSVSNGLLIFRERVVIPAELRSEVMENIHEGHMGTAKCRDRATSTVWWPGITRDIKAKVNSCQFCQIHKPTQRKEPLKVTELPLRPWQKVSADLCDFKGKSYLVVVDYYSRYLEIAQLPTITSLQVIMRLKNIFAHWGVPEELVSDNGTQFASREFAEFAKKYGFRQIFSSPHYPQGNGEAESGVKTAKRILAQDDIFAALMAYRATPIMATGASPSQLIMGRQIRTTVPVVEKNLLPKWPNLKNVKKRDTEYKRRYAYYFNRRHGAKELPDLDVGDEVKLKLDNEKLWSSNGVVERADPETRSYLVRTPQGAYQRNRRHLQSVAPNRDRSASPCNREILPLIGTTTPGSVTPEKPILTGSATPRRNTSTAIPSSPIMTETTNVRLKRSINLPARLKDCVVTMK